jgi:hypothetical protein
VRVLTQQLRVLGDPVGTCMSWCFLNGGTALQCFFACGPGRLGGIGEEWPLILLAEPDGSPIRKMKHPRFGRNRKSSTQFFFCPRRDYCCEERGSCIYNGRVLFSKGGCAPAAWAPMTANVQLSSCGRNFNELPGFQSTMPCDQKR